MPTWSSSSEQDVLSNWTIWTNGIPSSKERRFIVVSMELIGLSEYDSEKLIIWTASTISSYDPAIYNIIRNVSSQLNHSVIPESDENGPWHLIWSYEYIFDRFTNNIRFMKLKPYQLINHYPGFTFLTNKLHLSVTTSQRFIPSAFNFPSLKNEFLYYAKLFPKAHFVVKNMDRGGIEILPFEKINFRMGSYSYLQVFIESLLIENHAFDLGIYVLVTSVDPLRVYRWNKDILIRFCPEEYEPFTVTATGKYVCSTNFKNIWEMEAFEKFVESGQQSSKEMFNNYLDSKGHNSTQLWTDIDYAINTVVADKVQIGLKFMNIYTNRSNNTLDHMFELLRFDFIVDKELNVHLLEINMSPDMNFENEKDQKLRTMSLEVVNDTLKIVGAGSYHEIIG
ncbi:probable tubulin polyglutamylase ttll-15 [Chironomus tepperi]|uniref:probable tubulin polyglutamylase ttll-15 n=1 Tax=Chironomus tepperi TaxID=113505 RepID=UPI00391F01A8